MTAGAIAIVAWCLYWEKGKVAGRIFVAAELIILSIANLAWFNATRYDLLNQFSAIAFVILAIEIVLLAVERDKHVVHARLTTILVLLFAIAGFAILQHSAMGWQKMAASALAALKSLQGYYTIFYNNSTAVIYSNNVSVIIHQIHKPIWTQVNLSNHTVIINRSGVYVR